MKLCFILGISLFLAGSSEGKEKPKTKGQPVKIVLEKSFFENLKETNFPPDCKLKEVIIGDKKAPVTVTIFSSFTCSHCRTFHLNEFPKFKKKYVDTGKVKVRFMFYIDDMGAMEGAISVVCLGGDSIKKILHLQESLYGKQKEWIESKSPKEKLRDIFVGLGFDRKKIESCIADKKFQAGVMNGQKTIMHDYHINTIPAAFVNGKTQQG
ncbi:MAG: DsbA family protein, partial [Holosporaceae bacterium]|nr:DsbA family protein [Holosporaceae bacterium]